MAKNVENVKKNVTAENLGESFEVEFLPRRALLWRSFRKHKLGILSMWILAFFYVIVIFADFLSPTSPFKQNASIGFAAPSKIYWKHKGEWIGPHIYPLETARDPITYQRSFYETSELYTVKGSKSDGSSFVYTIGENNVTALVAQVKIDEIGVGETGETLFKTTNKDWNMVRIEKEGIFKEPIISLSVEKDTLDLYRSNPRYARTLQQIGVLQQIKTVETLQKITVKYNDGKSESVPVSVLEDYDFKVYPIKWFVQSWEYKLLGFIPANLHLFGVDSPAVLYLFGGDNYGRDVYTRILFGGRTSLSVGLIGILITFTIGLFLGGVSGYYGGWADEVLMRLTEILISIPTLYLLISLRAILPPDLPSTTTYLMVVVILSFIGWPGMSRVIRGMVLSLKQKEFVEAAKAMGYPSLRIIWKHIIPNTATYIIVAASLSIPGYILGEAGLSFLGFGIREPQSSWGLMLSQAQDLVALRNYPWLLLPGLFLFIAILAFNLFGDALRDAFDPRSLGH
ncbi:MAG TPA: ABC transporter permease [Thermotogota bacterium]|nr:ABC transporter permease [Thermotogota bacterium]HNT94515.1 ABC transporter permease [Thermotogota bacterium]HOZ11146.1 ABC transporter permease [Thermotogota bacterium]HPH09266.1 ABC transporter permease [Thermotogota bacterium]HPM20556.1 ABC transporter permease [Thermotogota bacterium]